MAETEPKPVIEIRDLSKSFGATVALRPLRLNVDEGEFFALLGPSGCGKTTLLRLVAGFEQPDSGSLWLDGRDITHLRPNRRPLNLMFQSYALFPHMSVRANIAYGLEMEGLDRSVIRQRVDDIIATTRLDSVIDRKPHQLSGGQRQRVALARALVKEPRVLLLDEPLAALDRKLREQMQSELKRLQHSLGITFIVVTHDQDEAMGMADRIALMNHGEIVQIAPPRELYDRPASMFVADFIGVSGFVYGTFDRGVLMTQNQGSFEPEPGSALPDGTDAAISLRPESLTISLEDSLPGHNALRGSIVDTIFRGQSIDLVIEASDCRAALHARLAPSENLDHYSIGKQVWCNWLAEQGRLLPLNHRSQA